MPARGFMLRIPYSRSVKSLIRRTSLIRMIPRPDFFSPSRTRSMDFRLRSVPHATDDAELSPADQHRRVHAGALPAQSVPDSASSVQPENSTPHQFTARPGAGSISTRPAACRGAAAATPHWATSGANCCAGRPVASASGAHRHLAPSSLSVPSRSQRFSFTTFCSPAYSIPKATTGPLLAVKRRTHCQQSEVQRTGNPNGGSDLPHHLHLSHPNRRP